MNERNAARLLLRFSSLRPSGPKRQGSEKYHSRVFSFLASFIFFFLPYLPLSRSLGQSFIFFRLLFPLRARKRQPQRARNEKERIKSVKEVKRERAIFFHSFPSLFLISLSLSFTSFTLFRFISAFLFPFLAALFLRLALLSARHKGKKRKRKRNKGERSGPWGPKGKGKEIF